jgi:hypothetical protein
LDASYVNDIPDKILVKAIAIVPLKVDKPASEKVIVTEKATPTEKLTKIVGRRWHEVYAKMRRQSAHKLHFASRTKRRS